MVAFAQALSSPSYIRLSSSSFHTQFIFPVMDRKPRLFVDLPPDVLLQVFGECCVLDIVCISSVRE